MRSLLTMAGALALSGCAATVSPVQVTRFHLDQPIAPGTIALDGTVTGLEAGSYRAAVVAQLQRLGFKEGTESPRYGVSVTSTRDERAAALRGSPVTIGIGGGTGGYGGGVGIGASFGLGGTKSRTDVITRLSVRLTDRATGATLWEGRAETTAPSTAPAAQPGLAAEKLAIALFKDFPGVSGRTISVP